MHFSAKREKKKKIGMSRRLMAKIEKKKEVWDETDISKILTLFFMEGFSLIQ